MSIKKPTGLNATLRVGRSIANQPYGHLRRRAWPRTKEGIERAILDLFVEQIRGAGGQVEVLSAGGTHGLDFLLKVPGGHCYLELMEFVAPKPGDRPYTPGNGSFECVEYAERVFQGIHKKSAKYGLIHETPIDLLIYVTHGPYNPERSAILALRRMLLDRPHAFGAVFFLVPRPSDGCEIHFVYEQGTELEVPQSLDQLRGLRFCNFDMATGTVNGMRPVEVEDIDVTAALAEPWDYRRAMRGYW